MGHPMDDGAPAMLVKKADGTHRMVVDDRALNKITIKNAFPLPRIDELLDIAAATPPGSEKCFSKIDLTNGFHQIRMDKIRMDTADMPKTAFNTPFGHYEYLVMPFGPCNAPLPTKNNNE
jgi:Reverse transcriptase (RNA-dependent DNA polymerase)